MELDEIKNQIESMSGNFEEIKNVLIQICDKIQEIENGL